MDKPMMNGVEETKVTMLSPRGDARGRNLPQYLVTLTATLIVFSAGTSLSWTAPALPMLTSGNSTINVTLEEGSWIGSLLPIGALVGSLPAGAIADRFGRKKTMLFLAVPFLLSWSLILTAGSVYPLYIARLLAGLGVGATGAVVPIYISEVAEPRIRGTLCSCFQLMLVVGILYTYVVGAIASFKMLSIACGVIPLIYLGAFLNAPETPIYLLNQSKKPEAKTALHRLRGLSYDAAMELEAHQTQLNRRPQGKTSILDAFKKRETVKAVIITVGIMALQQLMGINVVVFYAETIFIDAGSSLLEPRLATIAVGVAQVIACCVSTSLVDKAGRKPLLLVSSISMAVCHGTLGWFFHIKAKGGDIDGLSFIPVIAVVAYIVAFSLGFGPVPYLLIGELFADETRGLASSLANSINWAMAFIITKTFQSLAGFIGLGGAFWLFAGICLATAAFVWLVVIETKGKSITEIQEELGASIEDLSDRRNQRRSR